MIKTKLVIGALSAALLSTCVIASAQPMYVAPVPPPAPYAEVVPAIPFPGAVWIGGYWGWDGGHHHWVPGRWDHPRVGYRWRPHAWVHEGGHWRMHEGGWVRR
jgi:hypothetical protein